MPNAREVPVGARVIVFTRSRGVRRSVIGVSEWGQSTTGGNVWKGQS